MGHSWTDLSVFFSVLEYRRMPRKTTQSIARLLLLPTKKRFPIMRLQHFPVNLPGLQGGQGLLNMASSRVNKSWPKIKKGGFRESFITKRHSCWEMAEKKLIKRSFLREEAVIKSKLWMPSFLRWPSGRIDRQGKALLGINFARRGRYVSRTMVA